MIGFSVAGLAHAADFNPGAGVSTPAATSPNVIANEASLANPGTNVAPGLSGTAAGHPVSWYFGILVILVILKYVSEAAGDKGEFKDVKIGFLNIVTITFSAILGLIFLKWVFGMFRVPGLSDIVLAA